MTTSAPVPDPALVNTQIDEYYDDVRPDNIKRSFESLARNPYPGLRPFRTSESAVFFGRQEICLELINRLSEYNFLAVIGASGTGKSSLVRAGLLPKLQSLPGKFGEWRVAICRPGQDPFANLARAAFEARVFDNYSLADIVAGLKESSFGFETLYKDASQSANQLMPFNTLIVIDQFEELFRYRRDNGISGLNDAALFVKMLISISENRDLNTYVLLTMRTEYLNDCVQIPDLAEKINRGQFLVPGLNINQLKETIILPLMFTGTTPEEGIENKIIGELGEIRDQLPVLQHALRATYEHAKNSTIADNKCLLNFEDYKAIGKIQNALNQHAARLYNDLNERQKQYCKLLFQCLTERTTDGRLIRRPSQFGTIFNICVKDKSIDKELLLKELSDTVNRFRADDVSFLMPPQHVPLDYETEIDISHESLMRNWTDLHNWITEEVKYGNLYRYLNDSRKTSESKPGCDEWITGGKLDDLIDWRDNYTNNATWAARYSSLGQDGINELVEDCYAKNIAFLNESKQRDEERIKHDLYIKNQLEEERLRAIDIQNSLEKERIQADAERIQAENKRLKDRRRNSILLFLAVFLVGGIFTYVLAAKNKQINEEKLKARREIIEDSIRASRKASSYIQRAQLEENNAKAARVRADSLQSKAELDSTYAEEFYKLARGKQLALQRARYEFQMEKDSIVKAEVRTLFAKQTSDSLQQEIYKFSVNNDFQKHNFFNQLAAIDSNVLNSAVNQSLSFKKQKEESAYNSSIDSISRLLLLNRKMDADPNSGYVELKSKWSNCSDTVIRKLILAMINNHIYYRQNLNNYISGDYASNYLSIKTAGFGNNYAYLVPEQGRVSQKRNDSGSYYAQLSAGSFQNGSLTPVALSNPGILEPIGYLKYINKGIIAVGNKTLFQWDPTGKHTETQIKNKSKEQVVDISDDGKYIITRQYLQGDYRFWNMSDFLSGKNQPIPLNNSATSTFARFAPGNGAILTYGLSGYQVYIIDNNGKVTPKSTSSDPVIAANFSPDGSQLITISNGNKVCLTTLDKKNRDSIYLKDPGNRLYEIRSIALSPDSRSLLIECYNTTMVINHDNGDPVLSSFGDHKNLPLKYKVIPYGYISSSTKAAFVDNDSFITYDRLGNIFLWTINKYFPTIANALSSIQVSESTADKISQHKLTFDQVLSMDSKDDLLSAANYYRTYPQSSDTNNLAKSRTIYFKLLGETGNMAANNETYAEYIIAINGMMYRYDTSRAAVQVNYFKSNIALTEKYIKEPDINTLSTYYGDLGWYSFFIKDFSGGLAAAKKGIAIDKTNGFIITNVALGYLLTRDFKEAEKIYKKYKDKTYDSGDKDYIDSFNSDLNTMKTEGIIDANDTALVKEVKYIQDKILAKKESP